ncbi:hypothetical protein DICSQDRAFT_169931 [Dichomitus squalens LYAD-421 SS1]|uniref:Uncharacterized protein n=1 Tax=Dichomitus squalens (strain LYAD-421) TaxID=732165 RepID=R7T0J2_DICSQ|nr:uncharacterized protein DICSQDRAFT_169931 [Dichomitus squalens LYAD-421 SS1]EJF61510.1 hypothetical protein DICSQDRAFT_169931 [Dichomitus squalens LYAD-421 SS1]
MPPSDFLQGSSSSSRQLGPKAAFNSDMEDDNVDSESKGYNIKKGKQCAFNNANRAVLCRNREQLISQVTGTMPQQPAPPPPAPTLPALGPSAGLDPPRIPGGMRQPHMAVWQEAMPIQAADAWSDYVPLNHQQYWELVRSARAQGGGAYNHVRDLLHQYAANGALGAFNYLHQLKMSWSDPHRTETQSQARRAHPLERWLEYWHQYLDTLLVYLPITPQLGRPTRDHTRGHILLRALIPKLKGAQQSAEHAQFLEFYERRNPNSGEAFLQWPHTMAEVTVVPALVELALQKNPGATTSHVTAPPPPPVIEGINIDETMEEAQGVDEGQADEPGPSGTVLSIDAPGPSPPSA